MNLPFTLPDWLPWWAPILLLVPALMWALAFLFMPFSVIGLKGRLEAMEAQLEELQSEIRGLAHRLPEPLRQTSYDDIYAPPGSTAAPRQEEAPVVSRPPIPPAAYDLHEEETRGNRSGVRRGDAGRSPRSEPRLDWPR
jgi:hypothetical protein